MSEATRAPEILPIDKAIEHAQAKIERAVKQLEFLKKHRDRLMLVPVIPSFCGDRLDFDRLEHAEVLTVLKAVGGKWSKSAGDNNSIHYETKAAIDGFTVRCWNGKPPPSCKIIEIEEHVPAQVIPATVRKVRKLVCHPSVAATIAMAAEQGSRDLT